MSPGIYIYYVGAANYRALLYNMYFDGMKMNGPTLCDVPDIPDLATSPCVLYDPTGAYAGDKLPRIHIFVITKENTVWWLSTVDGQTIIVHNKNLATVTTQRRFSALLLSDGIHLYFEDQATSRIAHVKTSTNWTFSAAELLFYEGSTAEWGVAAVEGLKAPIVVCSQGKNPSLQLYYFTGKNQQNQGDGDFGMQPPIAGTDINMSDAPNATVLGDKVYVLYKGLTGGGDASYEPTAGYYATMTMGGVWSGPHTLPQVLTTNSLGSCVYGSRLFCFFQSSNDNTLYLQALIGLNWLDAAVQIATTPPEVWYGPAAVAVEYVEQAR